MEEFPASWVLLPVSETVRNVTLTDKKIPQKSYLPSGKFPVFDQGQDYVGGYTDDAAMVVDCELPAIVFGDHTRVVKLVNTAFAPGADGVKVLQPSACILPKLLEHFVRYLVTKIPNNGYARHYQHLAKSLLPIPPLAEQHRIVAKIEELFSDLDQGVVSLKTAREQLKVYRQSLLKNAFEGKLTAAWRAAYRDQLESATALQKRIAHERQTRHQQQLADWQSAGQAGPKPKPPKPLPPLTAEELAELPELPEGWGWVKTGDLGTLGTGVTPLKSRTDFYAGGTIPWVTSGALNANYVTEASDYVTSVALQETNLRIYPKHALLVALYGEGKTRGKCSELLIEATTNQAIAAIVLDGTAAILRPYVKWFFQKNYGDIRLKSSGGVQPNLNLGIIENTAVPMCSLAEAAQLVDAIESKLSEADQLDQTLATALQQADALRQAILKKAFSGQLVAQDKNDEPATALLERIRAGKSNGMSTPRNRRKSG